MRELSGVYAEHLAPLRPQTSLQEPQPNDIDNWKQTALNNSSELASATINTHIQREEIRRREAEYLPSVNVAALIGFSAVGGNGVNSNRTINCHLGIELNVPIYSSGFIFSQMRYTSIGNHSNRSNNNDARRID